MLGKVSTAGLGTVDGLAREVDRGRRFARWLGTGMAAMDLAARDGDPASGVDLRAVFGRLTYPNPADAKAGPGEGGRTRYLGAAPKTFGSEAERLARALEREPEASEQRRAQLAAAAARPRKAVAYYGLPFSAVKSISVLQAALLAAGESEQAAALVTAQQDAAAIAVRWGERHLAWTRRRAGGGSHEWELATGLVAVATDRTVSAAGDPHLTTQILLLNRVAMDDGRVGALDGRGIARINSGLGSVYDRALEQLLTEGLGVHFAVDNNGRRQVAGVGTVLQARASRRRRQIRNRAERGDEQAADGQLEKLSSPAGSRDEVLQAWIRDHRDDLREALTAVRAAASTAHRGEVPSAPAVRSSIEEVVATALSQDGVRAAGVMTYLTLGQQIEIVETALGPAGALGVPAQQRPYLVEEAVRSVVSAQRRAGR